jgi:hypothetical protein
LQQARAFVGQLLVLAAEFAVQGFCLGSGGLQFVGQGGFDVMT